VHYRSNIHAKREGIIIMQEAGSAAEDSDLTRSFYHPSPDATDAVTSKAYADAVIKSPARCVVF
jgi:hypothetical protein